MAASKRDIRILIRTEVEKALKDIDKTEQKLDDLGKKTKSPIEGFTALKGAIAGFIAALAVRQIASFALETAKLYGVAKNLQTTFKNLAEKEGLDAKQLFIDIQKATGGAVDRIELLKNATQAKFLGIDLKNLPILFEFARNRAKETGQDVDYLVNSIVTGIGRKSPLILDNLGLQMSDIRNEVERIAKETGTWTGKIDENVMELHLQEAAVSIANKAIKDSGELSTDASDGVAGLNAQWADFKILIGAIGDGPVGSALQFVNTMLEDMGVNIDKLMATGIDREIMELEEKLGKLAAKKYPKSPSPVIEFIKDPTGIKSLIDKKKYRKEIDEIDAEISKVVDELNAKREQKQKELDEKAAAAAAEREKQKQEQLALIRAGEAKKAADLQKKMDLETAMFEYELAVQNAQNKWHAKYIAAENWYKKERAANEGNTKALTLIDEIYAAKRKEIAQEILDHNAEVLDKKQELEFNAEIEITNNLKKEVEKRKDIMNEYANDIAQVMQYPMEELAGDIIAGMKSGKDAWKDFLDYSAQELNRWLAHEAVKFFFKMLFDIFGGKYTGGGFEYIDMPLSGAEAGPLYTARGMYVPKTPGGTAIVAGEAGEDEIVVPVDKFRDFAMGRYMLPGGFSVKNIPGLQMPGQSGASHYDYNNSRTANVNNSIVNNLNGAILDGKKLLDVLKEAQRRDLQRFGNNLNREAFS